MSLIYADSFDGYTTAEIPNYWTDDKIFSASVITTTPVHYGTQAIQPSGFGLQSKFSLPGTFCVGFALYPAGNPTTRNVFNVKWLTQIGAGVISTNTMLQVSCQGDGAFLWHRAVAPALDLASTNPKFALTTDVRYYYLEFTTGINAAQLCELRVDGNLAYSGTLNTRGTDTFGGGTVVQVALELAGGNGNFFDDFYMTSLDGIPPSGPVGEVGVAALFPTADGSFTQWTPNSGIVHFSRVNEKPADGDTTYNLSSAGLNNKDTYKISTSVVNNTDIIPGVEVFQLSELGTVASTDTATVSSFNFLVIAGATYTGPALNYGLTSYAINTTIYGTNPLSSAAWTGTGINQTEWGIFAV